jgi:hypothetical protein
MEKVNYSKILTGQSTTPVISITEEDVQKMKDKTWKATLWDFDNWVGEYLKPNENPANKALLAKVYPEWLERQKQVIENYHDFKKRVETLKITGPKNKEDLFLFYRLGYPDSAVSAQGKDESIAGYAGRDEPPGLGTQVADRDNQIITFQRGLFNWNRKENTGRALFAHKHSVFQGGSEQGWERGDRDDPAYSRHLYAPSLRFGGKYPKPTYWGRPVARANAPPVPLAVPMMQDIPPPPLP